MLGILVIANHILLSFSCRSRWKYDIDSAKKSEMWQLNREINSFNAFHHLKISRLGSVINPNHLGGKQANDVGVRIKGVRQDSRYFEDFLERLLYVGWENGTENVIILVFFLWYEYINLRCVGASVREGKKDSFKSNLVNRVRSYYRQASVSRIHF